MRTESVTQEVKRSGRPESRTLLRCRYPPLENLRGDRAAVVRIENAIAAQVTTPRQGFLQPLRQRNDAVAHALASRDFPFPHRALDRQLPAPQIDIGPLEPDDLSATKARIAAQ